MGDRKSYEEILSVRRPEPAADDWFDLYDDISKARETYEKNLMLSDLNGSDKTGEETTYYRRTRLKAMNCKHVFGTEYKCGTDPDNADKEIYLWKEVQEFLLGKANLVLLMSRPRNGRILKAALDYPKSKERLDADTIIEKEEKGGVLKQLFKGKNDKKETN